MRDSHGNVRSVTLRVHRDSLLRIFSPLRWPLTRTEVRSNQNHPISPTISTNLGPEHFNVEVPSELCELLIDFTIVFFGAYPNFWGSYPHHAYYIYPSKFPPASPSISDKQEAHLTIISTINANQLSGLCLSPWAYQFSLCFSKPRGSPDHPSTSLTKN